MQADEELLKLGLSDLPGVGWAMTGKLEKLGLTSVADVRNSRRELLQRELGAKSGTMARCLPSICTCTMHACPIQPMIPSLSQQNAPDLWRSAGMQAKCGSRMLLWRHMRTQSSSA